MTQKTRHSVSTHYHPKFSPRTYHPNPAQPSGRRVPLNKTRPPRQGRSESPGRLILAGGSMLALATLFINPNLEPKADDAVSTSRDVKANTCIKQVEPESFMSRDELSALLKLDRPAGQAEVYKVIDQPFCVLGAKDGSTEANTERQAYPLEFDPQTWFVLNYKDGKFVDYDFLFQ
jgi:hypothetical protein